MTALNPDYPVRLDVDYPPRLSRPLIFVKWLLAIPHFVVLAVIGIIAWVVLVIAFFAVLITGRYPQSLFDFLVGYERWRMRVSAYVLLQTDRYPPFALADDPAFPVRIEVDYPEQVSRWRPLVHWLLAIPALVGAFAVGIVAYVAVIIAWFAILITGRYPESLFNAVTVALRWSIRTTLYIYWAVERYPPFVWA
jgi:Domain of unknown function (DUF4389)